MLDTELARKYLVGELDLLPGLLRPLVRPLWLAAVPWLMLPPQAAVETMLYAATAPAEQVRVLLADTRRHMGGYDKDPTDFPMLVHIRWMWRSGQTDTLSRCCRQYGGVAASQVAGKFIKHSRPCKAARAADDERIAASLWDVSCKLTQRHMDSTAPGAEAAAHG